MRYKNASDILPDKLLKELQKYAAGKTIYIPSDEKRKKWGSKSGSREFFRLRNEEIQHKYFNGISIDNLADEYGLSTETIKKIIYK